MASIKSSSLLVVGLAIAVDCLLLFACVRASAAGRRGRAQAGAAAGGYAQPSDPAPPFLARALPVIIAQVVLRAARSYCRATLSRLSGVGGSSRRARRASALAGVVAPAPSAHPSLGHSACAISAALRRGTYSSVEVVRAHVAQARAADGCCNAIRSERFAAALVEAAAADVRLDEWRASGRTADILPPLLGVPCVRRRWRPRAAPPPPPSPRPSPSRALTLPAAAAPSRRRSRARGCCRRAALCGGARASARARRRRRPYGACAPRAPSSSVALQLQN